MRANKTTPRTSFVSREDWDRLARAVLAEEGTPRQQIDVVLAARYPTNTWGAIQELINRGLAVTEWTANDYASKNCKRRRGGFLWYATDIDHLAESLARKGRFTTFMKQCVAMGTPPAELIRRIETSDAQAHKRPV